MEVVNVACALLIFRLNICMLLRCWLHFFHESNAYFMKIVDVSGKLWMFYEKIVEGSM